jgi:secondary thiamine-phosphate synthase enzyme
MHSQDVFEVHTRGRGFTDVTGRVAALVAASGVRTGICQAFLSHTSASLILCENADADVRCDLEAWARRLAPDGDALFTHVTEGPDDMPAHVRSIVAGVSVSVPVGGARLCLGTWQGIYLWEHRLEPQRRQVTVTVIGDAGG